jgi:hypothetical protein
VVGIAAFPLITKSIKNLSGVFSFIAWIFSEIMILYYSSDLHLMPRLSAALAPLPPYAFTAYTGKMFAFNT